MKKVIWFLGILSSFLIASCIEDFSVIPIKAKREVAVFCVLNESPIQHLKLYYIGDNGLPGNQPVEGAKAWLCCQDTTVAFDWVEGLEWSCNYQPFYGERIELKVLPPGQDTLRSVTVFPKDFEVVGRSNISKVPTENIKEPEDSFRHWVSYELYESNKYNVETYYTVPISWDCCLWVVPGKNEGFPTAEYLATDHIGADNFNVCPGKITDLPCFNPDSIKNSVYQEVKSCLLFVPECLPHLKLHYKVLRIKHSGSYNHPPKKEEENYYKPYRNNGFLLLSDTYDQLFFPPFGPWITDYMYVYSVSDEFDAYLKKTYEKILDSGNLITDMYETDTSYSNIHGGRGVFGSCIVRIAPARAMQGDPPPHGYYPFPVFNH